MKNICRIRFSNSHSDTRKSKSTPEDQKQPRRRKWVVVIAIGVTFSMCGAFAHAQSNFFQGKTVRVIRGGQPRDPYDLWMRHIATYLGKHIPGNLSIIVQNVPGAGSVIAAYRFIKKGFGISLPGLIVIADVENVLHDHDRGVGKQNRCPAICSHDAIKKLLTEYD